MLTGRKHRHSRESSISLTHSSHLEFTSGLAANSQEPQEFFVCMCAAIKRWENAGSWGWTLSWAFSLTRKNTPVLTGVTASEWSLTCLRLPGTLPILLSLVHSVLSPWQEFHIFSSYLKLPTTPLILNWWHCLLFPVRIRNNRKRPSTCPAQQSHGSSACRSYLSSRFNAWTIHGPGWSQHLYCAVGPISWHRSQGFYFLQCFISLPHNKCSYLYTNTLLFSSL